MQNYRNKYVLNMKLRKFGSGLVSFCHSPLALLSGKQNDFYSNKAIRQSQSSYRGTAAGPKGSRVQRDLQIMLFETTYINNSTGIFPVPEFKH